MIRPKIALILLRAEWFDSVVALPQLSEAVREDEQSILRFLEQHFEVRAVWAVHSAEHLESCVQALKSAEADLFILCFQVWAEDFYLLPILRALAGRPLAVWCYLPWSKPPRPAGFVDVLRGSGPVGTLEGLGTMRNVGARFFFTQGSPENPQVAHDLGVAARAAWVKNALLAARFGLLPSRNEQMQSTFVDEFRLLAQIGPSVQMLSVGELKQRADEVPQAEVDEFLRYLRERYLIRGVSEQTLERSARASLGLAHLALDFRLDVLSLNDISPELHRVLGLRPCLYPPLLEQSNVLVGLEGDLGAATALFALQRLTASPILFVEFWFWDEAENLMVGGHAGIQNPQVAAPGKIWISHDFEYAQSDQTEGAHYQFVARPGKVTLLQLRATPRAWQAIVATGEAIECEPWVEGYPHAVIRLDAPLDDFVRRVAEVGSTQHWIMAYGDAVEEISVLCQLLDIRLERISAQAMPKRG
jgi:L-fucose isomerase-like protein